MMRWDTLDCLYRGHYMPNISFDSIKIHGERQRGDYDLYLTASVESTGQIIREILVEVIPTHDDPIFEIWYDWGNSNHSVKYTFVTRKTIEIELVPNIVVEMMDAIESIEDFSMADEDLDNMESELATYLSNELYDMSLKR